MGFVSWIGGISVVADTYSRRLSIIAGQALFFDRHSIRHRIERGIIHPGAQPSVFDRGLMYLGLGVFVLLFIKESRFVRPERTADSSHWQDMKSTRLSGVRVVRAEPVLLLILIVSL